MSVWWLSNSARSDLASVYAEGILRFGAAQFIKYRIELEECFAVLAAAPRLGREHCGATLPIRVHFHKAHVIAYRIDDDSGIVIVRVLPARTNWREFL
jgi:toxin ParE1/3/4